MKAAEWHRFADKVRLAIDNSQKADPRGGTSGLEIEFNILDSGLRPVERIGYGPESRSFADFLHDERLPVWAREHFQLEVFSWMIELTTQPCYSARATAAQARLLEGVLLETLAGAALGFGMPFVAAHGNIPQPLEISEESIPGGWNLARRRYLTRCVELFGSRLATAGIHTNHSLPDSLLSWDFIHLPLGERKGRTLEDYRNLNLIRLTRLLRPMCPVFIAVSAASPFAGEIVDGVPRVVLGEGDSHRLLAFPNPQELDLPGLYASHHDYLEISYGLVRSGVRFGANNWTPVRARSDVDPVRRNIMATSEQLRELYRRGIFSTGTHGSLDEAERAVVVENLCARVDLPMNRVEVRTDEGGDSFELSLAKVVFKDLLMLAIYGDPEHGAGYAYDAADIGRARRNEHAAARRGLDAGLEHPHTGRRVSAREYLAELLAVVEPLGEALDLGAQLEPLREMAGGGPNPATEIRRWALDEIGRGHECSPSGAPVIPPEVVCRWFDMRRTRLAAEIESIAASPAPVESEWPKLAPLVSGLRAIGGRRPAMPVQLGSGADRLSIEGAGDRTAEVVRLAADLVRIPSVTNCPEERIDQVFSCAGFIARILTRAGLDVSLYDRGRYPAVLASFAGGPPATVSLCGHFDVVRPEPDDSQFEPRIEGDYLWGRGAADMKTVVASTMLWMCGRAGAGPPHPPFNLLLVGNEENGEGDPFGTAHVLADLERRYGWSPRLMVVGERTGERGDELFGAVCPESRGILRMRIAARGISGHTGIGGGASDLVDDLIQIRTVLGSVFKRHLSLSSHDGWETSARFPFLAVGEPGVYNISAREGVLGIEVRPIPGDDLEGLLSETSALCDELGLEATVELMEPGVACPRDNPLLPLLLESVAEVSGVPPVIGKKKPGSSARFAPGGNQVVWGQTGIGPHSRDERHYIPSIGPYLRVLDAFAKKVCER